MIARYLYVPGTITDTSEEDWKQILTVKVDGVFYCSRHVGLYMIEAGGADIVPVSSEAGIEETKNQRVHNVSKAADESGYVTGSSLVIDGGMTAW